MAPHQPGLLQRRCSWGWEAAVGTWLEPRAETPAELGCTAVGLGVQGRVRGCSKKQSWHSWAGRAAMQARGVQAGLCGEAPSLPLLHLPTALHLGPWHPGSAEPLCAAPIPPPPGSGLPPALLMPQQPLPSPPSPF